MANATVCCSNDASGAANDSDNNVTRLNGPPVPCGRWHQPPFAHKLHSRCLESLTSWLRIFTDASCEYLHLHLVKRCHVAIAAVCKLLMGREEGRYSNACVDPSPIELIHFAY